MIKLILSIIIAQSAGWAGSVFTAPAIKEWYQFLQKPAISPPNWLFAPVWLTLYTLIGISLYLIWRGGIYKNPNRYIFLLFILNLSSNALWSIIFFGMKNIVAAFVCLISLVGLTLALILVANEVSKKSALLLLPYLLWISYAAVLNGLIWQLNV